MVSTAALPPELAAALNALDPLLSTASRRAAAALEIIAGRCCLARDRSSKSRLTGDGFPVELIFSSLDTAIRYTCEVASPEIAPTERLRCACGLLTALGQSSRLPLAELQEGRADLGWGAWLGGRHTATSDRYKIYVEIPENLPPPARCRLREALGRYQALLESQAYALRIAGVDPVSGKIELYFRGRSLEPRELRGLLSFAGLAEQEEALFSLLEEAAHHPARVRLPGAQHGFSISLAPAGEIGTFTFFVFARSMFGADPNTRSALLTLSKRRGWMLDHYAAVSALLQRQHGQGPRHGIVSFIIGRCRLPGISVGLRPVIPS
jgi:hypothetical protein